MYTYKWIANGNKITKITRIKKYLSIKVKLQPSCEIFAKVVRKTPFFRLESFMMIRHENKLILFTLKMRISIQCIKLSLV